MTELPDAERSQALRDADNAQRRWVESIIHKPVGEAARGVAARGNALLVWVDASGELRAQRTLREHSVIREFIPPFISRGK